MFLLPYNCLFGCASLKKIKTRGKTTFQKSKEIFQEVNSELNYSKCQAKKK